MVARSKAVVRVGVGVTISSVIWNPANGWPFRTRVRRLTKARRRAVSAAVAKADSLRRSSVQYWPISKVRT